MPPRNGTRRAGLRRSLPDILSPRTSLVYLSVFFFKKKRQHSLSLSACASVSLEAWTFWKSKFVSRASVGRQGNGAPFYNQRSRSPLILPPAMPGPPSSPPFPSGQNGPSVSGSPNPLCAKKVYQYQHQHHIRCQAECYVQYRYGILLVPMMRYYQPGQCDGPTPCAFICGVPGVNVVLVCCVAH